MLANESIAPDGDSRRRGTPWRWKKRMLIAMRAMLEGSATFM